MNIFSEIKQEKFNLIDPIDLFKELSKLVNEPLATVATAFIRLNNERSLVNIFSYEYDPINGIKQNPFKYSVSFMEAIVNGYERVIITNEIDDYWVGFWGLSKNGNLDYGINGINAFRPFYFIREEVSDFLNLHSIPLPPCITKKLIDYANNDYINDDDKLLKRINQLEQELQVQKINSESVFIPPLNIVDTDNLESENTQLKIDNKKLTEQLNNANKEIERLKKLVPILLGQYKNDDLLLLAIQARDKYWNDYTDTNPNYKSFSAEQIRRGIKKEFNHLSDRELNAIEFVSCPINRKK